MRQKTCRIFLCPEHEYAIYWPHNMAKITQILRFLTDKFYKIMLFKINYLIFIR